MIIHTIDTSLKSKTDIISPNFQTVFLSGLQSHINTDINRLLELEQSENYIAYNQLLLGLRGSNNTYLSQEIGLLYDKIFYRANNIEIANGSKPMTVYVESGSFVRLNETIRVNGVPTIADLRDRCNDGILFSGVAALQIQTKKGLYIPLIQRDSNIAIDAGKYTLPAGRADKTPGLTAYEEILEEFVFFGKKNDQIHLIVPYIQDGGISEQKALQLVSIARGKYINSLIRNGNISFNSIRDIMSANPIFVPMAILKKGEDIQTIFLDNKGNISYQIIEDGFFPFYDNIVNTYEMLRCFSFNLEDFDELVCGDGDGFGRKTGLFSLLDIQRMDQSGNLVNSLKHATSAGVFDDPL